jgi:hypothetical protein
VEELKCRDELIQYVDIHPLNLTLTSSSEFGRIEAGLRSLAEQPEPSAEEFSCLLEDLREAIFKYQVRLLSKNADWF